MFDNATTRRLAVMNLAIRGIEADIGKEHADTFRSVQHPDLRADYVLANPPFNDSDWFRKDDDVRWQFGVPPKDNANFAWVQHFIHHLAPHGMAGLNAVRKDLANGSMSSNQSGEGDITIWGQESNATTRRLAVMNLALRGIEADFGPEHADTFRRDLHPDLRADYVLGAVSPTLATTHF